MKKSAALFCIFFLMTSFIVKKDLTWVAIGDSITYLNDHANETDNRITQGYMTRVVEKLPNIHFINQGHNGWTAVRTANSIEKLGLVKADVYSVFLGTNDWWQGLSIGSITDYKDSTGTKTFYGAYRIIINKIRKLNNNAEIILITPIQRGDFVYVSSFTNNAYGSYKDKNGQQLSQFADAVKDIAQLENFKLVDLYYKSGINPANAVKYKRLKDPQTGEYKKYKYPDYTAVPFNPTNDEYPYPLDAINKTYDGLHPSDKGMKIIAHMLVRVMKKF